MSFADLARRASKAAIDHSPTILTSMGVAGLVTTTFLAGKASFEAADLIRLKEATEGVHDDPREQVKERVRLVWRLYIPAATMGAATAACIITANRIGVRRAAGLAAAYTILDKTAEEYKAKVVETIGAKKEEQIRADIVQDRVNATWDDSIEIHGKPDGEVFYDKFSDRYLYQTREGLREIMVDLNQEIVQAGAATLGDFYDMLGIPAPSWSHVIGWNSDELPRLKFTSALTPGGKAVGAFEYNVEPVHNYQRFH